ncbi:alcohol dehydrogenase catalytic domain-containing protein [Myxococcota bacterium]|nr:alcohol dehydrogenase catalytic domain-containing protein [Myxococcota bacterium]MBU1382043.1 alcohol dehydrogenase catalytic domain-containing protein [Myxococcota bacterium]MBU1495315.1 alcohol dehydrogenase catalytic domain-containing protein [Myxococcota bacterium]
MKAVVVRGSNGFEDASIEEVEIPQLSSNEVLIRMVYAPINPSDIVYAKGQYGIKGRIPFIPGLEGTGTVIEGNGYGKLLVGRRVACTAIPEKGGSFANYMVTEASRCVPLMKNLSWEDGATLLINPLTAWGLVERAIDLGADHIIVTQSSGALGHMLVRLCRERSIPVTGITRSVKGLLSWPENERQDIVSIGEPEAFNLIKERNIKFRKNVIVDGNGGFSTGNLLKYCPGNTSVIIYGAMDREPMSVFPSDYIFKGVSVEGFWLKNYINANSGISIAWKAFQIQKHIKTSLKTQVIGIRSIDDFFLAVSEYKKDLSAGKYLLNLEI